MNLFVVDSPIQYVNALEARYSYGLSDEDCCLLIFEGASKKNLNQILSLVSQNFWREIKIIKGNQHKFFRYIALLKLKLYIQKIKREQVEKIFIGEYRASFFRHIGNIFKEKSEIILLDDGSATIAISEMRLSNSLPESKHYLGFLRRWLDRNIFRIKDKEIDNLTFFTIYENLEISQRDALRINKYRKLKEKVASFEKENAYYFLGIPIVEMNMLSPKIYYSYLEAIKSELKRKVDLPIFYIPHRRESSSKLKKVSEIYPIKNFSGPLEIKMIEQKKIPQKVITFYSTFIDNAICIFGESLNIEVYVLEFDKINPSFIQRVQGVYDYYKKNYMGQIEIKEL